MRPAPYRTSNELKLSALLYRKLSAAAAENWFPTLSDLRADPEVLALLRAVEAERASGRRAA